MLTEPITVREATAEDIPFLRAMIWEAILASPAVLVQHRLETMQQLEEQYWSEWTKHPDPAFVAIDSGTSLAGGRFLPERPNWPVKAGLRQ